eukprot:14779529-Alexandrium_andersonii.AAC.1
MFFLHRGRIFGRVSVSAATAQTVCSLLERCNVGPIGLDRANPIASISQPMAGVAERSGARLARVNEHAVARKGTPEYEARVKREGRAALNTQRADTNN